MQVRITFLGMPVLFAYFTELFIYTFQFLLKISNRSPIFLLLGIPKKMLRVFMMKISRDNVSA